MYSKYLEELKVDNFPLYTVQDSMVKSHLTREMFDKLSKRKTSFGTTLEQCIQPSCEIVKDEKIIGLVAGDEECFEVYKDLFDPVINEQHQGFGPDEKQPPVDLDASKLTNGKLDDKYVRSCRIRTARNISGVPLPPQITREQRRKTEKILSDALNSLDGDLKGHYYPLSKMNKEDEDRLRNDHFLFQKPNSHIMVNSKATRDWPDARGIWHNDAKNFLAWINEEDQCRIISMQLGGDMQNVFSRFSRGLTAVENVIKSKGLQFQRSNRLGFLSTCPSNIGSSLRCSVHIQLRNLAKRSDLKELALALGLDKRGTSGEETAAVDDIYDISNFARVKMSEREFVQHTIDGVNKLIEMDKRLEEGKSIDDLLPQDYKKPEQ